MLFWGLRQTSDRKGALKNDSHLGYNGTLILLDKTRCNLENSHVLPVQFERVLQTS